MKYKGHLYGGILTSLLLAGGLFTYKHDWETIGICGITSLIMSLYPDLDIASKPSRYAYILGIPAIIALAYFGLTLQAILLFTFIAVPKAFPHRGFVHTLRFGLIASTCWMVLLYPFVVVEEIYVIGAGLVGYFTHLLLDNSVRL